MSTIRLGVRWTIGDVSAAGFEALRLSILGAFRCFGEGAAYLVCVNSLSADAARQRVGALPLDVEFRTVTHDQIPASLRRRLDDGLSQGTAWKFAPLRVFERELALDNDCILWRVPTAIQDWLDDSATSSAVIAEDVRACFGRFAELCGPLPRNSGIRGLSPGFDLERALARVLETTDGPLHTELDEQGLQIAAVSLDRPPHVVSIDEVAITSPVPPHRPHLGSAGAHFVGLNARRPWCEVDGRPITELVQEHWARLRPRVARNIGVSPTAP